MTVLVFEDRGWTIATASWSLGSKKKGQTDLVYTWGADGISWFESATGTSRVTFNVDIEEFLGRIRKSPIICRFDGK